MLPYRDRDRNNKNKTKISQLKKIKFNFWKLRICKQFVGHVKQHTKCKQGGCLFLEKIRVTDSEQFYSLGEIS